MNCDKNNKQIYWIQFANFLFGNEMEAHFIYIYTNEKKNCQYQQMIQPFYTRSAPLHVWRYFTTLKPKQRTDDVETTLNQRCYNLVVHNFETTLPQCRCDVTFSTLFQLMCLLGISLNVRKFSRIHEFIFKCF